MKSPTQKDVAQRAGVSRSTVSYVLNDQTDLKIPISPETRQRVLKAIYELGYEPDARAQALRRGNTKIVGVLFPILQNPFYWELLFGISAELRECGYSLHLIQTEVISDEDNQKVLKELARYRVEGLIVLGLFADLSASRKMHKAAHAIVEITSSESQFDHVLHAYSEGTRELMAHLLELGHRRIGFIYGVAGKINGLDRLQTYFDVLKEVGISLEESLVQRCGDTPEDGYHAALQLFRRGDRPTAVLVINDLLAVSAIRAAIDAGLKIPDDISIAGFDDIPFANYTVPRLTSVSGMAEQSGRDAVRLLLKRLKDPDRPREAIVSKTRLIIRESTGPVPASLSMAR